MIKIILLEKIINIIIIIMNIIIIVIMRIIIMRIYDSKYTKCN